jgi:hypothetical protein
MGFLPFDPRTQQYPVDRSKGLAAANQGIQQGLGMITQLMDADAKKQALLQGMKHPDNVALIEEIMGGLSPQQPQAPQAPPPMPEVAAPSPGGLLTQVPGKETPAPAAGSFQEEITVKAPSGGLSPQPKRSSMPHTPESLEIFNALSQRAMQGRGVQTREEAIKSRSDSQAENREMRERLSRMEEEGRNKRAAGAEQGRNTRAGRRSAEGQLAAARARTKYHKTAHRLALQKRAELMTNMKNNRTKDGEAALADLDREIKEAELEAGQAVEAELEAEEAYLMSLPAEGPKKK